MATATKDRDLQKELDALKTDLGKLQGDIVELTSKSGDIASDALTSAKANLEEEAEKLLASFQDTFNSIQKEGESKVKEVEKEVADKPVTSLLTTLGIGFAIGWLLSRK